MMNCVLGVLLHGMRIGDDNSFLRNRDDGRKHILTPVVTELQVCFLGEEARLAGSVPYRQSNAVPGERHEESSLLSRVMREALILK